MMFLSGVSTRTLPMISHRLIGHKISSGEVSRCSRELVKAIENWRNRDLSLLKFKYLFCDGVYSGFCQVDIRIAAKSRQLTVAFRNTRCMPAKVHHLI